jgi:hypothetical protein
MNLPRSAFLLLALLLTALAACPGGDGEATSTTVDLTEEEEAWWCESITEAIAWGFLAAQ